MVDGDVLAHESYVYPTDDVEEGSFVEIESRDHDGVVAGMVFHVTDVSPRRNDLVILRIETPSGRLSINSGGTAWFHRGEDDPVHYGIVTRASMVPDATVEAILSVGNGGAA